jgi:hypothetical protein
MTERTPQFDAAVTLYEAAQKRLLDLVDAPEKDVPASVYRAHLQEALKAQQRAHKRMMEAWA